MKLTTTETKTTKTKRGTITIADIRAKFRIPADAAVRVVRRGGRARDAAMNGFEEFPKIARLKRECMISEKIDGTNAQVFIVPFDETVDISQFKIAHRDAREGETTGFSMFAGSRSRYITPSDDNFGFAKWVAAHVDELWSLGPGRHFGEWWGSGIQRGYGLPQGEKRFSLFNAWRWNDGNPNRPACCHVVPNLYTGQFSTDITSTQLERLSTLGSVASPGFMKPEGICIYLSAARTYFKQTLEKDDEPKSRAAR